MCDWAAAGASGAAACAAVGARGPVLGRGIRESRRCQVETEIRAPRSASPKHDAQPNGAVAAVRCDCAAAAAA